MKKQFGFFSSGDFDRGLLLLLFWPVMILTLGLLLHIYEHLVASGETVDADVLQDPAAAT